MGEMSCSNSLVARCSRAAETVLVADADACSNDGFCAASAGHAMVPSVSAMTLRANAAGTNAVWVTVGSGEKGCPRWIRATRENVAQVATQDTAREDAISHTRTYALSYSATQMSSVRPARAAAL